MTMTRGLSLKMKLANASLQTLERPKTFGLEGHCVMRGGGKLWNKDWLGV